MCFDYLSSTVNASSLFLFIYIFPDNKLYAGGKELSYTVLLLFSHTENTAGTYDTDYIFVSDVFTLERTSSLLKSIS